MTFWDVVIFLVEAGITFVVSNEVSPSAREYSAADAKRSAGIFSSVAYAACTASNAFASSSAFFLRSVSDLTCAVALAARAESSDKLGDAVDYDALYRTVREVVEGKSFHLLEALAAATAETILERFEVRKVRVRIAKQNLGWTTGGRAVIEVTRERRS